MTDWRGLESKYYMQVAKRVPLTLVRGSGARVWDDEGREYLDFVAGWAVDSLGHCHPAVVEAVSRQVAELIHVSNQFYSIPQVELAKLVVENSALDRVFLCNSGAEANEGAVKLARRYGALKLGGAYEVITTWSSFHGRTLAMTAATGQGKFQKPYAPLTPGFVSVNYNDIEAIKTHTTDKTCAVMVEPLQGEGGVNLPTQGYLAAVRDWCRAKGILFILDEIQTGVGRLGTLFAYQQYGVEPDIMTLAKGLASGMPVGAIMATEEASVFTAGEHGSTFGGNPVACAAAYATVKFIIDNGIAENAAEVGDYLGEGLMKLKGRFASITDVRGKGLLWAMEMDSDIAKDMLEACLDRGLLINCVKPNTIRLMPPLIIGRAEVDEALGIIEGALGAFKRSD